MNGKMLTAFLVALALLATGLLTGPALSGEQPWDSDRTGGGGKTGGTGLPAGDTVVVTDTTTNVVVTAEATNVMPTWYGVVTAVWSAMMAI